MKKHLITVIFCCLVFMCRIDAQQNFSLLFNLVTEKSAHTKPVTIKLFNKVGTSFTTEVSNTLRSGYTLQLDKALSIQIFQNKPSILSLPIPAADTNYYLELAEQDISQEGLNTGTLSGTGNLTLKGKVNAVHYRGYVAGFPKSLATMSVFENGEVMILFSNKNGNFNLGKIKKSKSDYVLYNNSNMKAALGYECSAATLPQTKIITQDRINSVLIPQAAPAMLCKKVRVYWEADYKLYNNNFNGNLSNTANYLAGLFNQVSAMYQNEGVIIELNDTYIWTSQDPYNTSSAANGLSTLQLRWNGLNNNFNADLCMLIDGAPTNNGGIAYILDNDLCNRTYCYGYANVYATYNTVPVYSWDVEVLTHEMGHLLGSNHTHWCGWNTGSNGSCGAIDNCFAVEPGSTCTTCSATTNTNPSAPAGFLGTVMSYCYLRDGIGVNLSNGFGPLPQTAIRNSINNAICPYTDNKWTGAVSTAWENVANWSCGSIPDEKTDVIISTGLTNYPVVNSAAVCRKIKQLSSSRITVRSGFSLKLTGSRQ